MFRPQRGELPITEVFPRRPAGQQHQPHRAAARGTERRAQVGKN